MLANEEGEIVPERMIALVVIFIGTMLTRNVNQVLSTLAAMSILIYIFGFVIFGLTQGHRNDRKVMEITMLMFIAVGGWLINLAISGLGI